MVMIDITHYDLHVIQNYNILWWLLLSNDIQMVVYITKIWKLFVIILVFI